ncbi:Permease of the drug/metabolite transporter (DMT) superfamily [Rubrivivax sp. A210]|uniref:EamA family transporter n=1 Tax=Rubrivivax sp. A210 TaxID=2772301 RepID=UPI001917D7E8|nr:EamA family transporter [Rubrivivax sp. A210]CAD5373712.1 Permease of the drug/metabolite transporter (DMT) superfamily [Rubrivivax sp. A210]
MSNAILSLPMPSAPRLSGLIVACLAATWIVWGSTYLAIKWALVSFPPFFQMGTRFVAAGLLLGAWAAWRGARWPTKAQWVNAAVLGALMLGGGYGATALAQTSVNSGLVVAFIAVVPALVALIQCFYGQRPSGWEAAGILLGLAGVLLLTRGQGFAGSLPGLLAIATACLTWSLGSVWALRGLPGGRPLTLAPGAAGYASQMLVGGLMLLGASWLAGEQPTLPPDALSLACWFYLVVAGSLIGFSAYMVLLQQTTPTLASTYTFVNPVIGLVLGVVVGGEAVSSLEWTAAAIVSGGVVLLLMGGRR